MDVENEKSPERSTQVSMLQSEESFQQLRIESDANVKTESKELAMKVETKTAKMGPPMERKVSTITDSSIDSNEDCLLPRVLPKVNCMEKIILCIDLSQEMEEAKFTLGNRQTYSGIQMMKRTLEIFIKTKNAMDPRHQFALVILTESVVWLCDFTNNLKELCDVLKDLTETFPYDTCNLAPLFPGILERTKLPQVMEPEVSPPPFVVRVVILYGRSQTLPIVKEDCRAFKELQASDYFFMDFLYIHPPPSDENKCHVIFNKFCDWDPKFKSYILELTRKATKMHNMMAMLLGHPLQRPVQSLVQYKIQDVL